MRCEVCGRIIRGKPHKVKIEGAELKVCSNCAKFGVEMQAYSKFPKRSNKKSVPQIQAQTTRTFKKAKSKKMYMDENLEVVEDYNIIIKNARESLGLTREELGKKINEKESVIARIESGKMIPDIKLAKKLEKALNIKILEKIESESFGSYSSNTPELTIGDIVQVKIKKTKK